ncbi:MAG TPA: alpha/beta hydrolase, partial [Propionibacteriaceae bacterium]|nr:alpha/beta hydrolase [Propionibacteriaceae bacterium]
QPAARHPLARRDRQRRLGLRHEQLRAALLRAHMGGLGVHALHAKAVDGAGLPLVLLHGWPSSFVQMLPIVPLLTTGANPFDVVVISLPGYGFSDRPRQRGMDLTRIAEIVVEVMDRLGYPRFGARGSDLGAGVLQQLALNHPDRLLALHLSGTNPYLGWIPDDLSPAEQQFVTNAQQWNQTEMAYALEHSSKPQTLAHALNDSPAGLAAWILEKFHRWSDCHGDLDSVYDRDDLPTNLTVLGHRDDRLLHAPLLRNRPQHHRRLRPRRGPTGMAMSSADMFPTPREWVERQYNVIHWTDLTQGGHFLEWEVPHLIADDLRSFFNSHRHRTRSLRF